jgi:hypothetical protein
LLLVNNPVSRTWIVCALLGAAFANSGSAQDPSELWSYNLAYDRGSTIPYAVITAYQGPAGPAVIPAEIDGHPVRAVGSGTASIDRTSKLTGIVIPDSVTALAKYAFWRPTNLASVTIGSGVRSIGYGAFGYAQNLGEIDLPDSVVSLGDYAFYRATNLARVSLGSGLTNIPLAAFSDCPSLREIVIPEGVTSIGNFAFNAITYRGGLTNVVFPSTLVEIGPVAFQHSAGLTSVTFPPGLERIGQEAFAYCSGLTNLVIGDGVTNIGRVAFAFCDGLATAKVGSGVSVIEDSLFDGCQKLESVVFSGPVTSVGDYAFADCSRLTTVLFTGSAPATPGPTGDVFGTNPSTVVYFRSAPDEWPASWAGRSVVPFRPVSRVVAADGRFFSFAWTGAGEVPFSVERTTSLAGGDWELLEAGVSTGQFTDQTPPRRAAFYRLLHP